MSKEEIISNSGMDDAESWWWFEDKVNLAMDEHAKEVAIGFAEWITKNNYAKCLHFQDGQNVLMWCKNGEGNDFIPVTTEYLFDTYFNLKNKQNKISFTKEELDKRDKEKWFDVRKQLPECNEKFGDSNYVLGFEQPTGLLPVVVWYNQYQKEWRVAHYKADSLPVIITHWQPLPDTHLLTQ